MLGPTLLALCGCGGAHQWYGEWQGDLQLVGNRIPDDPVKATINRIRLTLKPDGSFEMVRSGIPETGDFRSGGDRAFLTIKTRFGQPVSLSGPGTQAMNRDLTLDWQKDDSLLFTDPAGFDTHPVLLDRKAQR